MPPCGGQPNFERIEQEAELLLRLLGLDAEQIEHRRLHLLAVDTHRAAADLRAVQHHVVGLRERLAGRGLSSAAVIELRPDRDARRVNG